MILNLSKDEIAIIISALQDQADIIFKNKNSNTLWAKMLLDAKHSILRHFVIREDIDISKSCARGCINAKQMELEQ